MKGLSKSIWQLLAVVGLCACGSHPDINVATYVGGATCASCHQEETEAWAGSHHDQAMQVANTVTVLGDFNNAKFVDGEATFIFLKREQAYFVTTVDKDGSSEEYRIDFTFGVDPLQQYLVKFPGGRFQALTVAWDTRPAEEGGQQWFHLYPGVSTDDDDPLHWTGPNQNWNYMCADCHSTNVEKNYTLSQTSYETSWSDIDVSCEACHGPASTHVKWASDTRGSNGSGASGRRGRGDIRKGFRVHFLDSEESVWKIDPRTGNAVPRENRISEVLIETCAKCHSRRTQIKDGYEPGLPLMDYYRPVLLDDGLYHSDGQIDDEVYVYGSFLQSKMYAAGVTCSNCHDSHSPKLKASGNSLCSNCHLSAKYDRGEHHFHGKESAGAQCVNCHMPAQTYMQIDRRRDHSFRIPRPGLSDRIDSPNACNTCHDDKTTDWARQWSESWYHGQLPDESTFEEVIYDGRRLKPGTGPRLSALSTDSLQPGIIRATALSLLANYRNVFALQAAQRGVMDADPLVRLSALGALELAEPAVRIQFAFPLLRDSIRAVRVEAARILAPISMEDASTEEANELSQAIEEYISTELTNADRPEAHLNLGLLYLGRGEVDQAEASFFQALKVDPKSIPARINLSDLYRIQNQDRRGETTLREALILAPESGEAHHALGLNLIRQQRHAEAIKFLDRATFLKPDDPRFSYVYAVALNSMGGPQAALLVLEQTHNRHPRNKNILVALTTIHRDEGSREWARMYATRLVAVAPQDQMARQLLDELSKE